MHTPGERLSVISNYLPSSWIQACSPSLLLEDMCPMDHMRGGVVLVSAGDAWCWEPEVALPATRSGETRSSLGTGPLPRAPRCPQAVGMWWPKGMVLLVSVNGD